MKFEGYFIFNKWQLTSRLLEDYGLSPVWVLPCFFKLQSLVVTLGAAEWSFTSVGSFMCR